MSARWHRHLFDTASLDDPRPVKWPPPGPYWVTGQGARHASMVAYLPPDVPLTDYWPEAENDMVQERDGVLFTSRFPRPDWWTGEGRELDR